MPPRSKTSHQDLESETGLLVGQHQQEGHGITHTDLHRDAEMGVTPALPSPPEMGAAAPFLGPRGWFLGRMERRHAHGSCPASSGRKGRGGGGGGWAAPQFFRMVS